MKSDDQLTLGRVTASDATLATCLLDQARLDALWDAGRGQHQSIGAVIRIDVDNVPVFGTLVSMQGTAQGVVAECEYIGEGAQSANGSLHSFRRGSTAFPRPGDPLRFATEEELATIFAPPDLPHIHIGTVFPTAGVRAPLLFDQLLGRHFAVVGSSGAGKSTAVAMMLDRILAQSGKGHIIVLDPHGEYAHAFGDAAQIWDPTNLVLPYWALNLEEHCEVFVASDGDERMVDSNIMAKALVQARRRNIGVEDPGHITADTPVAYQFADLVDALEAEAGKLEKIADAGRYTHLRLTIGQFFHDRRYRFIFDADHAGASLEQLLGDVLRIPNQGKPISIVDLAGVPTEIVNVVVATLSRLVLDYAIWAPRDTHAPILLLCEEAHRCLPRVPTASTRSVRRQLERIAREGRKYGVCLGLVTQRPSELSETALSQCGTILSLRLNNQADQAHLAAALTEGARSIAGSVSALRNRECIVSGEGTPIPMRVMIDSVDEARRPASDDPSFSGRWSHDASDDAMLAQTVQRWRAER